MLPAKRLLVSLCLAWLPLASPVCGQTSVHGSLRGKVVDSQNFPVQKASVTLEAVESGIVLKSETEEQGFYQFARLSPGRYKLTLEKPGFRTASRADIEIAVNETAVVDIALTVGQVQEAVTVTEAAGIVQTDRVEIGGRVDERRVRELPLNGENFAKLVFLAPGVASGSPNNPSISGARPIANSFTVDGATSNDERWLQWPLARRRWSSRVQRSFTESRFHRSNPGIFDHHVGCRCHLRARLRWTGQHHYKIWRQ